MGQHMQASGGISGDPRAARERTPAARDATGPVAGVIGRAFISSSRRGFLDPASARAVLLEIVGPPARRRVGTTARTRSSPRGSGTPLTALRDRRMSRRRPPPRRARWLRRGADSSTRRPWIERKPPRRGALVAGVEPATRSATRPSPDLEVAFTQEALRTQICPGSVSSDRRRDGNPTAAGP